MLVEEKKINNEDGTVGYYDAVFNSSNILQTTYFPRNERLYISFKRGGVYSYENIAPEMYEAFKIAESQGKFFADNIKNQPKRYTYRKEHTLYPAEVTALNEIVEDSIEENETTSEDVASDVLVLRDMTTEATNFVFMLDHEEVMKIDKEGFYWKGNMIANDEDIYDHFKEFLAQAIPSKLIEWINSELKLLEEKEERTQFEEGQLYELKILKQWI